MSFYTWFSERKITGLGAKRRRKAEELKMKACKPFLPERVKMLEIGPGIGWFAAEVDKAGYDYEAVEPSKPLREMLVEQGLNVVDGMTPPIPKDDGAYDFVYSDQVLEHFPSCDKAIGFAQECNRVLKPGGILCLVAPNYLSQRSFFYDIDYTHNYVTTHRRMLQLVKDAGFEVLRDFKNIGPSTGIWRTLQLIPCWIFGWTPVVWLFSIFRLSGVLHSIRKNLFETIILVARKPATKEENDG